MKGTVSLLRNALIAAFAIICVVAFVPNTASASVASGSWGTCAWELDEEGVFTLHPGTGTNTGYSWPVFEGLDYDAVTEIVVRPENGEYVVAPADCSGLFSKFTNVTSVDLSGFDTSNATILTALFDSCSSLSSINISNLNISKVTSFNSVFYKCSSLTTVVLPELSTQKLENITALFAQCTSLKTMELKNLNAPKLTNSSTVFSGCTALESVDISGWNVPEVYTIYSMFDGCTKLSNLNISGWNAPKIDMMNCAFQSCSSLEKLGFSSWSAIKPTRMLKLFNGCTKLADLDISNIDSSAVTDASNFWSGCSSLSRVSIGKKFSPNMTLPTVAVNGHTSWFSETDGKWYTSSEIRNNRTAVADTYNKYHDYQNPVFNWSDDGKTCSVTYTCSNNADHKSTYDCNVTSAIKEQATCSKKGTTTYTATYKDLSDTKDVADLDIVPSAHVFKAPTYNWSNDYKTCTATRVCKNDSTHKETETVNTTAKVTKAATYTAKGQTTYTAQFANNAFVTQIKTATNVPMLPKKVQPMTVKGKMATIKYSKVKKKAQTLAQSKILAVSNAQGIVTYAKVSGNKKITINKTTGKITVKKKTKKGKYKIKITVAASGNANYKAGTRTVTVTIKVK